ncbi:BrnT family toxin [Thermodesulfobacteriota bacterium]
MKYEWDENKRVANIAKHGVDFIDAENFDWSSAIETIDDRFNYSEEWWIALGFIGNRLHVLTYTAHGENIRLISLRKANEREKEYYEEKT